MNGIQGFFELVQPVLKCEHLDFAGFGLL